MAIISNGFCKFHLAALASEVARRGRLTLFLTAGYPLGPTGRVFRLLARLQPSGRIQRLSQRYEQIPEGLVRSFWLEEGLYQLSRSLRAFGGRTRPSRSLNAYAFRSYGVRAARVLARTPPAPVYHYRSGMGGVSVEKAKSLGMIALCDHSCAHPSVFTHLIDNKGEFPAQPLLPPLDPVEKLILDDLIIADHILVNSEFVKSTLLYAGIPGEMVSVIYLGVDSQFMDFISHAKPSPSPKIPRLLFAGRYYHGKGATELADALKNINDLEWSLTIAAGIDSSEVSKNDLLLRDARVANVGFLARSDLATRMLETDIFVFPSLSEGSARVVFEALACGCYVITTPNSGSIVLDGVHGAVVPPGDANALETAIRTALADIERVRAIGTANADLIRSRYSQAHYADQVLNLYDMLLTNTQAR